MVYLLLAEGFEEVEALLPLDILRRGGVSVSTVGITGKTVKGSHGSAVEADLLPPEVSEAEIEAVILPGGMPGSLNLDASPEVDRILKAALANQAHLAAICAAPLVLGRRGLLRGRKAVCYPGFEKELEGAEVPQTRVVTDGGITTAVGMGAAAEFGFALLSVLKGEDAAKTVRESALFL